MNKQLADLLYPTISKSVEDYLEIYPPRKTPAFRYAPSPTGFLHIGGVGTSLVNRMLANSMKGIVFLRIEDTDQKREVEGATEKLVEGLAGFGINFEEGFDGKKHFGKYAPYRQSERVDIYHAFAKRLVEHGQAYPCFCTSEELTEIRETQTSKKENPGYYGKYVKCSKLSLNDIEKKISKKMPWVLRLNPKTNGNERIEWIDNIRGKCSLPAIVNNPVIIKSDGIPPYNFAHVVDDLLMRTSHVVRGEEWFPSTAEHIQIWRALNLGEQTPWTYSHPPVICMEEDGKKRKLSKRKDKFALAENILGEGYPRDAVIEYLLSLYNTDFEMWRIANLSEPISSFNFRFEKIGTNSPLFDENKLNHISREIIAKKTCSQINKEIEQYFKSREDEQSKTIFTNLDKIRQILALERETPKPRKDIVKYGEIYEVFEYLFKAPKKLTDEKEKQVAEGYAKVYTHQDSREQWFERIKELCTKLGYAANMKDFKTNPDAYQGSIGDFTQVIRRAITGRDNTPDMYQIMQILGENEVMKRLS
ncbi:MAG: glutamate--tRNA ligase [Firmicutes bacterium]|nr:glutamate--tRNA ligase [Bacillota bacterium]